MTPRVAIIGAGLAGLTAARRLLMRASPPEVVIIDAGRHAGGRFCTQTASAEPRAPRFDLGAQVLYARRPGDKLVSPTRAAENLGRELVEGGLFRRRAVGRVGAADERASNNEITGVAAVGGMNELPYLLNPANPPREFLDYTVAERLVRNGDGWRIHTRSLRDGYETIVSAHGLILTPPVPQALDLLARNKLELPDELRYALRDVRYSRCIALYGLFAGAEPLPAGGVWLGEGPLEWIADNRLKEVSAVGPAISALTTDEWATEHWAESDARVVELLLPHVQSWVGDARDAAQIGVRRWEHAKPLAPLQQTCAVVRDLCLVMAGDSFAGAAPDPADAAVMSGEAAARRMALLLSAMARHDSRLTVSRPRRYSLEVAVSTAEEANRARVAGADRLELSSALEIGGLTPSMGVFRAVRGRVRIPIYVMLRPRAGGFAYSDSEFAAMCADADEFLAGGATGIVFAVLTERGGIDHQRCRQLVDAARGRAVFHRAFDLLPHPITALDELIELGFERVLTSGGQRTAEAGTNRLTALVQHAGWDIEVLPAGTIRPNNVADLVTATWCDQVHAAAREPVSDPVLARYPSVASGLGQATALIDQHITGLRQALDGLVETLS